MRLCKDKRRLYRRVKRMLGKTTPLRADCGLLCEKRCCKGDDGTGMLLFPKEATSFPVRQNGTRALAVCKGNCKRSSRPLSCRMFPLIPVRTANGKIRVQTDKRGAGLCPLIARETEVRFSERFLHRMKRAGKLLYADTECRAFLEQCLAEGAQTEQIIKSFLKK